MLRCIPLCFACFAADFVYKDEYKGFVPIGNCLHLVLIDRRTSVEHSSVSQPSMLSEIDIHMLKSL